MKKYVIIGMLSLVGVWAWATESNEKPAWREDFSNAKQNSSKRWEPVDWELKTKMFTSATVFDLVQDKDLNRRVLHMFADKATGTYMREVQGVDLKKYPVMRFAWRVKKLPPGGDGRFESKDDQAIGVYVGTGRFRQDAVAYRWETVTPKTDSGKISYGGGAVSVSWFCLRNQTDSLNVWHTETVNVANDFMTLYGYIPERFAVSVVSNSQNTKSVAEADLSFIEFLPIDVLNPPAVAPTTDSAIKEQ